MSDALKVETNLDDTAELEAAIARIIADIEQKREQMARDQAEIDRLKVDARALQLETLALLDSLKVAA